MTNLVEGSVLVQCGFCTKAPDQVRTMIAGRDVYICDECVELCSDTLAEQLGDRSEEAARGEVR